MTTVISNGMWSLFSAYHEFREDNDGRPHDIDYFTLNDLFGWIDDRSPEAVMDAIGGSVADYAQVVDELACLIDSNGYGAPLSDFGTPDDEI